MKIRFPYKLYDTETIAPGGRIEQEWTARTFENVLGSKRAGARISKNFKMFDQNFLIKHFGLRGFEYGNWLNQEERFEYLSATALSLHDLAKIIGFNPKQIGLNKKISIAFGARGSGKALAHFEAGSYAINLTKFHSERGEKNRAFSGGGVGSLGHEWAHALDCFIGTQTKENKASFFITETIYNAIQKQGNTYSFTPSTTPIIKAAQLLIRSICFTEKEKGKFSYTEYYSTLKNNMPEYWHRIIEIFARAFETHLYYQGLKKKIINPTLFKPKYTDSVYITKEHYKIVEPYFVSFLNECKKSIPK
jgi:hypothetical protein